MEYRVNIALRAARDLAEIFETINAARSVAALQWYRGLREAILGLERLPLRNPKTPESAGLRHLLYGRKPHIYRVIYRVSEKSGQVDVLHIRHGARRTFDSSAVD